MTLQDQYLNARARAQEAGNAGDEAAYLYWHREASRLLNEIQKQRAQEAQKAGRK